MTHRVCSASQHGKTRAQHSRCSCHCPCYKSHRVWGHPTARSRGQPEKPLFGKLPAKELRLLKQHSCCDGVFSPAQPREGLGSQPSRTVTPQTIHHVLPCDTSLPTRTFCTCRRRETRAGCDGLRLRCAGHGIFQGLQQKEALRSPVVPPPADRYSPQLTPVLASGDPHQKPAVPSGDFSTRGDKTECHRPQSSAGSPLCRVAAGCSQLLLKEAFFMLL